MICLLPMQADPVTVARELLRLLLQYPNGLTKAVMLTQLQSLLVHKVLLLPAWQRWAQVPALT